MKILIIGNKGFIGTNVYKFYSATPSIEVWGCDVVTDYSSSNYFLVDATNASYEEVFQDTTFDVCVNCSGAASVPDSFVHPSRDFQLNVVNVQRMLEAIRKYQPRCKFVNLSSAAIYGNPSMLPVSESAEVKPLSPYGWNKYYAEQLCDQYFRLFAIPTCSLRIFSAFGPGLHKQIFWDWCRKIKNQSELQMFGTGKESRDFIFIDDLVLAIDCIIRGASFQADVINVASGREVSISHAASEISRLFEGKVHYTFNQQIREGDPLNWLADITKLRSLGYLPRVRFEEGLSRYVQWAVKE